ncbi:pectinesterase family protein [Hymenobacter coccineus]|uniref:pectinesterase family protein n=1 Tax=Hymenobacter coccineus TaxID=1908235 RepID=UPI0021CD3734|nr:pectinesterase family protein [Hymenobacter coccineus]
MWWRRTAAGSFVRCSRQFYQDFYIEGTVDFIFGSSTAWFENCDIVCKTAGFVTAASTPDTISYGYVLHRCRISAPAPAGSVALGRPWRPFPKTVYLDCELSAAIRPAGWDEWNKTANQKTAYYAEYQSRGPGAAPQQRAPWAHQLTAAEAQRYTPAQALHGWNSLAE